MKRNDGRRILEDMQLPRLIGFNTETVRKPASLACAVNSAFMFDDRGVCSPSLVSTPLTLIIHWPVRLVVAVSVSKPYSRFYVAKICFPFPLPAGGLVPLSFEKAMKSAGRNYHRHRHRRHHHHMMNRHKINPPSI